MTGISQQKTAIFLLSMGGPDKVDDVNEFLFNIFSDRNIIKLPGGALFQKPFAKLISTLRTKKVQTHYRLIGGGSPLLKWTKVQGDGIVKILSTEFSEIKYYAGMRYFHPLIEDSISQAYNEGFRKFVFLPLYPQYSYATTGSSFEAIKKSVIKFKDTESIFIDDFHDNIGYTTLLKKYIDDNIGRNDTLLFSAHSIPQSFVDNGDPYVEQAKKTCAMAAGNREYYLSFQSRTGPVKWVGPDTVDEVKRLLKEKNGNIFIVPVSFVCDHIETLYELDIELKTLIDKKDTHRLVRMPMFNDSKEFSIVLTDIIKDKVMNS